MQSRRFFATVWRVNAILILGVGVLSAAVLSVAAVMFFKDATRTRHVDNVANAVVGEIDKQVADLGSFEEICGSGVFRAPLNVRQTYERGSGYKEAGSTRNYLFFDPSLRSAYWLKPSMESLILQARTLPDSGRDCERQGRASAMVYVMVQTDSDGDGRLTSADTKQIAVSDPKGKNYRIVVDKADRMNEARLLQADRLLILYSVGPRLAAVELNPNQPAGPVDAYDLPIATK